MASLREAARRVLDEARDGILWIAVWKEGRGWHCETILGAEYMESNPYKHTDEQWYIDDVALEELNEILAVDPNAIMVNGYYRNIGTLEEMTLDSLVDGLRYQYELGGNMKEIVSGLQGEATDGADDNSERAEEDRAAESSAADLRQGADSGSGEETGAIRIGCKRNCTQYQGTEEAGADIVHRREGFMKFGKSVQDKLMDQFIDGMIASMSECDEPELKNFGRLMIKRKEMTELERAACDIVIHGHDVEGMDMLTEVFNNICQELRMVNEMLEAVHKKEESV